MKIDPANSLLDRILVAATSHYRNNAYVRGEDVLEFVDLEEATDTARTINLMIATRVAAAQEINEETARETYNDLRRFRNDLHGYSDDVSFALRKTDTVQKARSMSAGSSVTTFVEALRVLAEDVITGRIDDYMVDTYEGGLGAEGLYLRRERDLKKRIEQMRAA